MWPWRSRASSTSRRRRSSSATSRPIERHDVPRLLIDLGAVTFMDSAGLSAIVRAHRSAAARGRALVLRRGPGQVQRLFRLTGVHDRLTFADD